MLLGALMAVGAVATLLAFRDGGYFITSWGIASLLLWGLLVAVLAMGGSGLGGIPGLTALGGLVGLAGWQGASALWANEPAAAVNAMNTTLAYAAVLGLGLVLVDGRTQLRQASWCALGVTVVVAAGGVGARLLPDLIGGDRLARLNTPISYWNALGALLAFGLVLAIGLGGDPAGWRWGRPLALAATPLLALGLYFTLSRGAILLLIVALAAVVALAPGRIETLGSLAVAAGAAFVPIVMASRRDLTSLGGEPLPTALEPRRDVLLALAVCTVLAAAAGYDLQLGVGRIPAGSRRVIGIAAAVLAAVALVGGYAAKGPDQNPVAWADAQFQSFTSYGTGERNDSSVASQLATAAGTGRWQNWEVAWDEWDEARLAGTGAGDYRFFWNQDRPIDLFVVNAHSLYLEVLGESGLVGLVLLLLPLGAGLVVVAMVLVRRRGEPVRRDLVVGGAGAGLIALHAAGDWDWQLPAVMIPAVLVGAAVLKAGTIAVGSDRRVGMWAPIAAGVLAVVVVLLLAGPLRGQALVDEAKVEARAGDLAAALATARDAGKADTTSPTPRLVEAYVLTDLGRGAEADAEFAAALARSPRDWSIMADWAGSLIARGELRAAASLIVRAEDLNPREPRVASLKRVLRERRRAAAAAN